MQNAKGLFHQVHRAKGMMEPGVGGGWVDLIRESQLLDPPQSLKIGMLDHVEHQVIGDGDEPVNRVVDVLSFVSDWRIHVGFGFIMDLINIC